MMFTFFNCIYTGHILGFGTARRALVGIITHGGDKRDERTISSSLASALASGSFFLLSLFQFSWFGCLTEEEASEEAFSSYNAALHAGKKLPWLSSIGVLIHNVVIY